MSRDYRLVRRTDADGTAVVAIHEVYYDDAGKPTGVTQDDVAATGSGETEAEAVEDCIGSLGLMLYALQQPVLDYDSVGRDTAPPTEPKETKVLRRALESEGHFRAEHDGLRAENERLAKAMVEAVLPLELLVTDEYANGEHHTISPALRKMIHESVRGVRDVLLARRSAPGSPA